MALLPRVYPYPFRKRKKKGVAPVTTTAMATTSEKGTTTTTTTTTPGGQTTTTTTTTPTPTTTTTTTTPTPTTTTTTTTPSGVTTSPAPEDWFGVTLASNGHGSNMRPMQQGVYDHYSDKSFFCYMGPNSDPYVVECDHSEGAHTWGSPQKVLDQAADSDYNYPTIDILPSRRLVLCTARPHDKYVGIAISDNPADASAWTVQNVPTTGIGFEYPRIFVDRRGYIYVFYVHRPDPNREPHLRWVYYNYSKDEGSTWEGETLLLERDVSDPNGMCEIYFGINELYPRRVYGGSTSQKLYMAWTSSGGFTHTGTHDGGNDATFLTDSTNDFTTGTYGAVTDNGYLHNLTKGTGSGISSHDATTIHTDVNLDWDNGDQYGVAYHNIHHSHYYMGYFNFDDHHVYSHINGWDDVDCGTKVDREEMDDNLRWYVSPNPPAGKDTGYVPSLFVGKLGTDSDDIAPIAQLYGMNGGYTPYGYVISGNYGLADYGVFLENEEEGLVFTDPTKSWDVNEWQGNWIWFYEDAAGKWGRIASNTSNTITITEDKLAETGSGWGTYNVEDDFSYAIYDYGDIRGRWYADGYNYVAEAKLAIYRAAGYANDYGGTLGSEYFGYWTDWDLLDTVTLSDTHGYACYAVHIPEGHAEAILSLQEQHENDDATIWGVSCTERQVAEAIVLRTSDPTPSPNSTTTVYAYITEKRHGARSRIRNATNSVTLTVTSGECTVETSPVSAVNGMATFTINTASGEDTTVLTATADGLESYVINIYTQPISTTSPATTTTTTTTTPTPTTTTTTTTTTSGVTTTGISGYAEAEAVINNMATAPDATRKGHIHDLVEGLVADGIWAKLDRLWVFAAHAENSSLLDWIHPTVAGNACTNVDSTAFVVDEGYTGDGTNDYLNTNTSVSTDVTYFTQNSASAAIYCRTNVAEDNDDFGAYGAGGDVSFTLRNSGNECDWRLNLNGDETEASITDSTGMWIMSRLDSDTAYLYRNGSEIDVDNSSTTGLPTADLYILNAPGGEGPSTKQISMAALGGYLTATEAANFTTRFETFMDALGKGVIS